MLQTAKAIGFFGVAVRRGDYSRSVATVYSETCASRRLLLLLSFVLLFTCIAIATKLEVATIDYIHVRVHRYLFRVTRVGELSIQAARSPMIVVFCSFAGSLCSEHSAAVEIRIEMRVCFSDPPPLMDPGLFVQAVKWIDT